MTCQAGDYSAQTYLSDCFLSFFLSFSTLLSPFVGFGWLWGKLHFALECLTSFKINKVFLLVGNDFEQTKTGEQRDVVIHYSVNPF